MGNAYPLEFMVDGGRIRLPHQAVLELKPIVAAYGVDVEKLMESLVRALAVYSTHPWAVICFESCYPLSGHIAELRGAKDNMAIVSYEQIASGQPPVQPGRVCPVSALVVRKKGILKALASRSSLLQPAWNALKDAPHSGLWLCISDPPPVAWVKTTAVGDYDRYIWAMIRQAGPVSVSQSQLPPAVADSLATGEKLMHEGRPQDAIQPLTEVTASVPGAPLIWNMLANAHYLCGNFSEAVRCSRRALALQPTWACGMHNLGIAYAGAGRAAEAAGILERYLKTDPFKEESWLCLAELYQRQGEWEKSAEALKRYLDLEPDNSVALWQLGHNLHMAGHVAESLAVYEALTEHEPDNGSHWNNVGYCLAKLGRTQDAVAACQRALELQPKMEAAWDSLGYAYLKGGQYEPAVSAFLKAIEISPKHRPAWSHLIRAYQQSGQADRMRAAEKYFASLAEDSGARSTKEPDSMRDV